MEVIGRRSDELTGKPVPDADLADPRRRAAGDDDRRGDRRRLGRDLGRRRRRGRRARRRAARRGDAERARLPRHAGPRQRAPPHVPEPDALLRARAEQRADVVGRHAERHVGAARRGGRVRLGVGRPGRARARRLHAHDRRPLRASAAEADRRRARGRPRRRLPLRPVPRRRRARPRRRADLPGRARAGPRHDHGRHRAADRRVPRPLAARDDADRRRAVGQLRRDARPDGGGRRAGRAPRRAHDDAPLAVRRRGGVVARLLRHAPGRLARERRLGARRARGSRTASSSPTRRSPGSRAGASASRTARPRAASSPTA